MTNSKAEVEFLERLYLLGEPIKLNPTEGEVAMNDHDLELRQAAEKALAEANLALSRAGQSGLWCYGCGRSSVSLDRCDCGFGESFRCGSRLFCGDCRRSRQAVAHHIEKLLATKPIVRVSSLRARYSRELSSAVRAVEGDEVGNPRRLLFWLSQLDDFETDNDRFRTDVLKAFRKSEFLDFQRLAANLEREERDSWIRAAIRAGLR